MAFNGHHDDEEVISEGPTSSVTRRITSDLPDGIRSIAVKRSTTTHAKEPHDIVKEVRLLASISHANIIPLINQESESQHMSYWMPYIPYALDELFQSSRFSPHPIISFESITSSTPTPREVQFVVLAKSIIFQVLCGVSHLHDQDVHIAHRDIKPANILLTASGRVQLIDFGISFRTGEDDTARVRDLWPESVARMYFEVSTGPYRAPELLFGPRSYDAFAIDAWSLGATFAEFFTSLRLQSDDDDPDRYYPSLRSEHTTESESESESNVEQHASADAVSPDAPPPPTPFVIPLGTHPGVPTGRWTRTSLFDGTRGEIGLAWSIFKVRGTPDADTWPSFLTLPDASKVSFIHVDPMDLSTLLPNLPPSSPSPTSLDTRTHTPPTDFVPSPLDLVHRFLVYEPSRRLRPVQALGHPWFNADSENVPGVVLPADDGDGTAYVPWGMDVETEATMRSFMLEGKVHTLGELLQKYVVAKESGGFMT